MQMGISRSATLASQRPISKAVPRQTRSAEQRNTLLQRFFLDDNGYTKMVDFWSLGVLVFEMCCGWSPFYAEETQQMYRNIAFGKVRFPRDALSLEGRNFVKGLLNRNPKHRLGANQGAAELKAHAFFNDVDWDALMKKKIVPPFKPKLKSELDVSNFDPEFTNALAQGGSLNARPWPWLPASIRRPHRSRRPCRPSLKDSLLWMRAPWRRTWEEGRWS